MLWKIDDFFQFHIKTVTLLRALKKGDGLSAPAEIPKFLPADASSSSCNLIIQRTDQVITWAMARQDDRHQKTWDIMGLSKIIHVNPQGNLTRENSDCHAASYVASRQNHVLVRLIL